MSSDLSASVVDGQRLIALSRKPSVNTEDASYLERMSNLTPINRDNLHTLDGQSVPARRRCTSAFPETSQAQPEHDDDVNKGDHGEDDEETSLYRLSEKLRVRSALRMKQLNTPTDSPATKRVKVTDNDGLGLQAQTEIPLYPVAGSPIWSTGNDSLYGESPESHGPTPDCDLFLEKPAILDVGDLPSVRQCKEKNPNMPTPLQSPELTTEESPSSAASVEVATQCTAERSLRSSAKDQSVSSQSAHSDSKKECSIKTVLFSDKKETNDENSSLQQTSTTSNNVDADMNAEMNLNSCKLSKKEPCDVPVVRIDVKFSAQESDGKSALSSNKSGHSPPITPVNSGTSASPLTDVSRSPFRKTRSDRLKAIYKTRDGHPLAPRAPRKSRWIKGHPLAEGKAGAHGQHHNTHSCSSPLSTGPAGSPVGLFSTLSHQHGVNHGATKVSVIKRKKRC